MSYKVTCPKCASTFNAKTVPPSGTKVKCPRCSRGFVLDERNVSGRDLIEEVEFDDPPPASPQKAYAQPNYSAQPNYGAQPSCGGQPNYGGQRGGATQATDANGAVLPQATRYGLPVWTWAVLGALSAVSAFIVVMLATGVFDPGKLKNAQNQNVAQRNWVEPIAPQIAPPNFNDNIVLTNRNNRTENQAGEEGVEPDELARRGAEEWTARSKALAEEHAARMRESEKLEIEKAIRLLNELNADSSPNLVTPAFIALRGANVTSATIEQREEIGRLLNEHLKTTGDAQRRWILSAAGTWATPANIPTLLELLESENGSHRNDIIGALATTGGDAQSAAAVAKQLETKSRGAAASALSAMPKYAEAAVLPLLKSKEKQTRQQALSVLRKVGGKEALQVLEALQNDSEVQGVERSQLKTAISGIKRRLRTRPEGA